MNKYIRCIYCGTVLGEIHGFDEAPSNAYCISCFADSKNWTEEDTEEILKEWEK